MPAFARHTRSPSVTHGQPGLPPDGPRRYSPAAQGSVRPARPSTHATEGAVYVACSTLCFARHPLERVLRIMAELEFSKVDVALHERGPHLKPSEVAADVHAAAQRLRYGPGLVPAAFNV